jgi:alanine racemase
LNLYECSHSQAKLSIDLDALVANWQFFSKLGGAEAAAVLKANAYGLGIEKCAKALSDAGCNSFFVAHLSEGLELRKYLPKPSRIFVLNGFIGCEASILFDNGLTPVINNLDQVRAWQAYKRSCVVHFDTGMNRLGIGFDVVEQAAKELRGQEIEFVMSHLACASDIEHPLNKIQLSRFHDICEWFPNIDKSLSASAGALLGQEYHFDLLRPGIGLYGSNPVDNRENPMRPVLTLSAPIIQVVEVGAGQSIGYGATYTAKKAARIAIVALGYADGFLRSASNCGFGVLEGANCPIVGRVSMDLIAIDISAASRTIRCGDRVEFLGPNADIDEQAALMGTIAYEILTGLGNRFLREYQ